VFCQTYGVCTLFQNPSALGLDFGKGAAANGATDQLFFTAGLDNYANGLFGVITVAQFEKPSFH